MVTLQYKHPLIKTWRKYGFSREQIVPGIPGIDKLPESILVIARIQDHGTNEI